MNDCHYCGKVCKTPAGLMRHWEGSAVDCREAREQAIAAIQGKDRINRMARKREQAPTSGLRVWTPDGWVRR